MEFVIVAIIILLANWMRVEYKNSKSSEIKALNEEVEKLKLALEAKERDVQEAEKTAWQARQGANEAVAQRLLRDHPNCRVTLRGGDIILSLH